MGISRKSRDEILYLTDLVLAAAEYSPPNPELLCVTCVVFVLKFENDFSKKFRAFLAFVQTNLGLDLRDVRHAESGVLDAVPDYFIHLPGFRELILASFEAMGSRPPSEETLLAVENYCLTAYMGPGEELSISGTFFDPVASTAFTGSGCSQAYEKLRAVLVSRGIGLQT